MSTRIGRPETHKKTVVGMMSWPEGMMSLQAITEKTVISVMLGSEVGWGL